jgi:hypothetical protein
MRTSDATPASSRRLGEKGCAPVQQLTDVAFDQGRQIESRFHVAILDHDRPVGEVHYELAPAPPALRVNLGRLHVRVTKPQGQASSFQEYIPVPGLVSHSPIGQLTLRSLDYRRPLRESPYYKGYSFEFSEACLPRPDPPRRCHAVHSEMLDRGYGKRQRPDIRAPRQPSS